jgi:hypothetical protein
MLKNLYGKVILQKDSILYHTSEEIFKDKPDKPMLFCTFHPSEFDGIHDYITYIKLKKNITLLFMIENFRKTYIFSSLNIFSNHPNLNLAKKNNNNLKFYVKELKKEKFDGWFTSIENKNSIEVALINDNSLFEPIKIEELTRNWRNGNNLNNIITTKNWGTKYHICSIEHPIIFKINKKFRQFIEDYINYGLKSKFPYEHVLQVILQNAKIYYHESKFDGKIEWKIE